MSLISLRNISFSWGGPALLDKINLEINKGERIGLLGRNGAGKSTLMRIIGGEIAPDDGEFLRGRGVETGRLVQEVPDSCTGTVDAVIAAGLIPDSGAPPEDWKQKQSVDRILSRMKLDGSAQFDQLSSGMKRRVLLGQTLVRDPQLILLDEPTNHLDIESIAWLEKFLQGYEGALLFVTHDRVFLENLATRIVEVDRGKLFDWSCSYNEFQERKQGALNAEERHNVHFDKKLAQEEIWIRQGIKARRTRNEGRVRALKGMREEFQERRRRIGNVKMQAVEAHNSGRLVMETEALSFSYGDEPIVDNMSLLLSRGDKIGIIGPNGAGKTTLIRLLLGDLQPTSGTITHGTKLEIIYFDQLREQIDEEKTVIENVGEGQDQLTINGKSKHIYGYLQDFLFTPERARRAARSLSGGERNRLLLARIFKRPSNLMILDEPTNDLDAETLELLEELVSEYAGTLLLVSHDRAFLNNVVTSTLVFEGGGAIKEYVGGYDDYIRQRDAGKKVEPKLVPKTKKQLRSSTARPTPKLTFKEKRELENLPQKIELMEQQQQDIHSAMASPEFYSQEGAAIAEIQTRLKEIDQSLAQTYARWEELESRAGAR